MIETHLRVCIFISDFGTLKQKQKFLPKLASGEIVAANAFNEKNGKTPFTQETIFEYHCNFTMNGKKEWVTGAKEAGLYAVFSKVKNNDLKC